MTCDTDTTAEALAALYHERITADGTAAAVREALTTDADDYDVLYELGDLLLDVGGDAMHGDPFSDEDEAAEHAADVCCGALDRLRSLLGLAS